MKKQDVPRVAQIAFGQRRAMASLAKAARYSPDHLTRHLASGDGRLPASAQARLMLTIKRVAGDLRRRADMLDRIADSGDVPAEADALLDELGLAEDLAD